MLHAAPQRDAQRERLAGAAVTDVDDHVPLYVNLWERIC